MSAGRRNGLSAADSNAERVKVRCSKRVGGALDGLEHGRGRLGVVAGRRPPGGRPPASARAVLRRAIAWRSRSAPSRSSSTWRRRSSRWARTASSSPSSASCAVEPVVRRLAGGGRRPRCAPPPGGARRGAPRRGGAGLGARDLGLEADRAARLLVALGLGRLAPAARRLGLTAQVLDAAELALQRALAGVHVAGAALGLAQPCEQRRVGHLGRGEEALPRAEDLDDDVGVRPVLGLQPVLRARRLADEHDPAVEVREVVGLLDEQRDLAQARVGLRAARGGPWPRRGRDRRVGAAPSAGGAGRRPSRPRRRCARTGRSAAPPRGRRRRSARASRALWLFFATGPVRRLRGLGVGRRVAAAAGARPPSRRHRRPSTPRTGCQPPPSCASGASRR